MGPGGILKVHPLLGGSQKVAQGAIGVTFSHCQLKEPHEPLRIAIIRRRPCPAHGADKAFLQQQRSGLRGSLLFALIGVEDRSRDLKRHHLDRRDDEFSLHTIIEGQR